MSVGHEEAAARGGEAGARRTTALEAAADRRLIVLERAMRCFVVYGAFEGLLKRLTGYAVWVYPIKDVFFLALLVAWFASKRSRPARAPLRLIVSLYCAIVLLEAFNPYLPNVIIGIAGIRGSYIYAVLFFVAFSTFRTTEQIVRFGRLMGWLAVITAAGGLAETLLGLDWVLDNGLQVATDARYRGWSGDIVLRPSSIGAGPGSAAMMELIGAGLLLGVATGERKLWRRLVYVVGALLALTGIFLAAVRIIWLMAGIAAATFVFLTGRRKPLWAVSVTLIVALAAWLSVVFSSGEILARFETLQTPTETFQAERLWAIEALPNIIVLYPFGAGVGWNVPRQLDILSGYYTGFSESVQHIGVHNHLSILALEVGVAGLVVFLLFTGSVLVQGLLGTQREADERRWLMLAACVAVFAGIAFTFPFGGGIIGWPGEHYWILAALIMRLVTIGREEREPILRRRWRSRSPGLPSAR